MNGTELFLPVLAHVFLVIVLFVFLIVRKSLAVKRGEVDLTKTALNNQAWTPEVLQVSNNIANQFETPVLFYILSIILALLDGFSTYSLVLAWAYVALRYIHCYIHIRSNYVPYRMRVFALSMLVLLLMLIQAAITLLSL